MGKACALLKKKAFKRFRPFKLNWVNQLVNQMLPITLKLNFRRILNYPFDKLSFLILQIFSGRLEM